MLRLGTAHPARCLGTAHPGDKIMMSRAGLQSILSKDVSLALWVSGLRLAQPEP
jgi:hypothetical protein